MATTPFLLLLPLIFSTIILLLAVTVPQSESYSTTTPFDGFKPEKLTHLHFYFHDVISGTDKPTAIQVAEAPISNTTDSRFGIVMVADDPLTEGPDPSSKEVGRAQGMYVSSDMKTMTFTMVFNLVFTEGEFKGSTVSMYGRNLISSTLREMPIIGGTGAFRFGRGYAQAKTFKRDGVNAIVEYNVFICH